MRLTDGQTDGRTEFSSLDHVYIPCSAVKTQAFCFKIGYNRNTCTAQISIMVMTTLHAQKVQFPFTLAVRISLLYLVG